MRISDWSSDVCSSDLVIKAQQQVDQRRLARTRRPDQADLLARADVDAEPADHPAAFAVMEMHILEAHAALLYLQRLGVLGVEHIARPRSEEHTSELQSLMRISYAVFCLQKQKKS